VFERNTDNERERERDKKREKRDPNVLNKKSKVMSEENFIRTSSLSFPLKEWRGKKIFSDTSGQDKDIVWSVRWISVPVKPIYSNIFG